MFRPDKGFGYQVHFHPAREKVVHMTSETKLLDNHMMSVQMQH